MRLFLIAAALTALGASTAYAQSATPLSCTQNAQSLGAGPGSTVVATCPAACTTASVWGTGVYSDDSAVCAAAVHAGAIPAGGGTVLVTIEAGQASYVPSTANGVTSGAWGEWGRSFSVAPHQGSSGPSQWAVDCGTPATAIPGAVGTTAHVNCPAGCTSSAVWGDQVYSDDSAICTAAIHAGVMTAAGGSIVVVISEGQDSYPATTHNGVASRPWGPWHRSFYVMSLDMYNEP